MPNACVAENVSIQANRIRCYHYNKAFQVAFNSPQTQRHQADSVIVRIDWTDDTASFGESAPRPYVTGEDSHSVVKLIGEWFAPILFNHSVNTIESAEAILNKLETTCRETGIKAYHSALAAIDLALLDALERSRRISPKNIFPDEHRVQPRFSASVPFLPIDVIKKYFPLLKNYVDVSVIKVLIGEDADANYERVRLIRQLANPETELRLEFNGKMTIANVMRNLERLIQFDISAAEQPLPPGYLEGLHQLRKQFGLNLVADESLVSLEDAKQLAKDGAYNIFNIKVSKCGGLLRSKCIAERADTHGILCQVGTHVGESNFLGIAGRRLARGLPNFDCYGGGSEVLYSHLFESKDQAAQIKWPPPAENDRLTDEECYGLISKCSLLADLSPGMRHRSPSV